MKPSTKTRFDPIQRAGLPVGVIALSLCGLGYATSPVRFFEAYLFAFLVVSGIGLGCMAVFMIQQLVGGKWGESTQGILAAAAWPLVATPLFALPLVFGIEPLFPWADADTVQHDPLLAKKAAYLNPLFFQIRAVVYLLTWAVMAALIGRWSRRQQGVTDEAAETDEATGHGRLRAFSAIGLIVYVLTMTFAAVDWMMSLEPHWFSAVYGVIVIAGQGAAAFCVAIVTLSFVRDEPRFRDAATPGVFQDLGNLLLAAVAFWIYVAFSQYLIIWSGNLNEEIPWYIARSRSGWQWLAAALVLFHFAVPFGALLSRRVKRQPRRLAAVAVLVFVMHVADVYWLVMPAVRQTLTIHWLDVAALVGLAAIWKAISVWRLKPAAESSAHVTNSRLEGEHVRAVGSIT